MLSIAHSRRFRVSSLVVVLAMVLALLSPAPPALADEDFSGSLANGTQWIAVVPDDWNGTLLLHSHGYLPSFVPFPNPAPTINSIPAAVELLDLGYAVAASSYADKGWALPTAPQDQLDSLQAAIDAIGTEPDTVLAYGTSMGGLVTAKIAESSGGLIDGAMPTCGIVAGGADLNNYQLDGAHAVNELLADGSIQIAGYASQGATFAASGALQAAVNAAVTADTPEARARVALAAALFQLDPSDLAGIIGFVTPARFDLITAAGGDSGWNEGVDYQRLFTKSHYRPMVEGLYRQAGLDLKADLDLLTATADVPFNGAAVSTMVGHSQPTGVLQMPVFSIHTNYDPLVPAEHEEEYADDVLSQGNGSLFRQAFVDRDGHCTFTSAELVAGVKVLEERVDTGRWSAASVNPHKLNQLASSLDLGDSAFIHFRPGEFIGDRSDSVSP
ncbi:MAG TPA: alpha/beta hydrolase [Acidimicrobiia bacterium]|nr:alpha/beta hydrolase [Acidimicrobiia bacterium]